MALLLTGCGTDDDGAAASPSSPAPAGVSAEGSAGGSPSASPSPAPGSDPAAAEYVPASLDGPAQNVPKPVMPELAREESRDGAQAFLDYWSDAKWYAYQTGDTSFAREIISSACQVCMDELKEIENLYDAGGWAIGGRESVALREPEFVRGPDGVYKPVAISEYAGIRIVESEKVIHEEGPKIDPQDAFQVYLDFFEGAWTYITAAPLPGAE